jgi:hypothetical protein
MGVEVPTIGQTAWGQPLNDALTTMSAGLIDPEDLSYNSWTYPPMHIASINPGAMTSGTVRMMRLPKFSQQRTVTGVAVAIGTVGSGLTAGQCFAGLYNSSGVRLGVSADISGTGALTTQGLSRINLTAPVVCPVGDYVVALLVNGTTPPHLAACQSLGVSSFINGNLPTSIAFVATGPAAQTSLPANIDMGGARTPAGIPSWAGTF